MGVRRGHFPRFAHWWPDAKNQLLKFPYGAHDDFVDFISHIGLGLIKELPAMPSQFKVDKVPKIGTGAWVVHAGRVEARRKKLSTLTHGW